MPVKTLNVLVAVLLWNEVAAAGEPRAGTWPDGFSYQWQARQIEADLPIERTIRLIDYKRAAAPKQIGLLNANAAFIASCNHQPVTLRMNNIVGELIATFPRLDPVPADWQDSLLCIRIHPVTRDLDQTPNPDPLGPIDRWTEAGRLWRDSPWMARFRRILNAPDRIILLENNEQNGLNFKLLVDRKESVEKVNGRKMMKAVRVLKPRSELEQISLRIADWAESRREANIDEVEDEFRREKRARYSALFDAIGISRTAAYGGFHECYHSTASPSHYVGLHLPADFTDPEHAARIDALIPQWEVNERANPGAWREISIALYPKGVYAGALAGRHDVVDPELWAAHQVWQAWRSHTPGREYIARLWMANASTPEKLILSDPENARGSIDRKHMDSVASLRREDLLSLTAGDYQVALLEAFAVIGRSPKLRQYWDDGTSTVLSCPLNDDTAHRVYAVEVRIPEDQETLVIVYTPCALSGDIAIGPYKVPAKRFAYYLSPQMVELQPERRASEHAK